MQTQEIDKALLATFMDLAIENKVSASEWQRFAVNHFADEKMEFARSECVKFLGGSSGQSQTSEQDKAYLHGLAQELRSAT